MSLTNESVAHDPFGPLQVYSRRKESFVEHMQIQELEPIFGNEVSALPEFFVFYLFIFFFFFLIIFVLPWIMKGTLVYQTFFIPISSVHIL